MLIFWLLPIFFQDQIPTKPINEFVIATKYELRHKPVGESKVVFHDDSESGKQKESGTDMLPYLTINLKVKRWADDISQVRVIDVSNHQYLKKKATEDDYTFDMGYVDDMKDKVKPGKFFFQFLRDKKAVEQIIIQVEEDGTFLVNGEKRGKF